MRTHPLLLSVFVPVAVLGQGAFYNLDFESATVPYRTGGGPLPAAMDAFPGWTVWDGNTVQTVVGYNGTIGDKSLVDLQANAQGGLPITGLYSAHFWPWVNGACALSQIGTIPAGSTWLQYSTVYLGSPEAFVVTFADHVLSPQVVRSPSSITSVWGADIAAYAGMTGELRFTESIFPDGSGGWAIGACYVDDITFVPEPGVLELLGLAGGAAAWAAWRRRRAQLQP